MLIRIIVTPHGPPGSFEARLEGSGTPLCISRTPLLTCARRLLSQGVSPNATIVMRHAGATHDALKSTVGYAAGLRVMEADFGAPTFKPYRPWHGEPPVEEIGEAVE